MARRQTKVAGGPVEGPWALPAGWRWERLGDVLPLAYGKALPAASRNHQGSISVYSSSGITGQHDVATCYEPALIVGRKGAAGAVHHATGPSFVIDTAYYCSRSSAEIDLRLGYHLLTFMRLRDLDQSTAVPSLSRDRYDDVLVPVPRRGVQARLAENIDDLFADLDDGEALLARARDDLGMWRRALLKAAVSGELTADWRAANPPAESGADLLARILDERRRDGAKARKSYVEPRGSHPEDLHSLPDGWTWVTVEQLCDSTRSVAYGVLQPGPDIVGGTALVRVMDITDGRVAVDQLKKIDEKIAGQYPRTTLRGGEVLLTVVGSIGRTALVPDELAGANTARAVAVLAVKYASAEWVELCFRFEPYRAALESSAHEVARKTLNLEDVRVFPIPVPPLAEQAELVRLAKSEIQVGNDTQASMIDAREAASALRQSILSAAFRGDLVA